MSDALAKSDTTLWQAGELLRDIQRRIADELSEHIYLKVHPGFVGLVARPLTGWDQALQMFPAIEADVTEAAYCLAFDRWTASVFHQMRIMDFGLDTLRRMVRVPKKRPGWEGVIEAVDRKLAPKQGQRKKPATRKRNRFIAEAVVQLRAVKEIRNTTIQDWSKTYTPEQSVAMYKAVQLFMQKMADVAPKARV